MSCLRPTCLMVFLLSGVNMKEIKFSDKELLLLRLSLLSQIWIEERALVVSRTQVKRLYKLFFKIQKQSGV